ncbi:DUF397 domain-containing protein [Streptomyces sp. ISL-22]|uniref:DUF397 domain-containing protein n=1 Tax=unclassified Streptomyces TaxID=2593676 RepID=UPI001BE75ED6|nr:MULTISPECIES: DUF397 domain-containing protein [unclassified Streptomyces]MBT2423603.1 DUF397 domain-containing protein [Streptomyces sp. ISL-24]MBT2437204.1 DUF397 domain-containing protein [Streptomyces sp. ISL-22]
MIRKVFTGDISELTWFKSSYSSSGDGESCVEIAIASRTIHVRDSKHTAGPRLQLSPEAWADFVSYASES